MAVPITPELLLPAGGFDSAIASIEGGADALYLGFADFSARKQARNFDRLEYRRLYRLARDRGIKLYAALNTVILEGELEAAAGLLAFLGRFPPDAVIVQDWGLARLIKDRHPGIAVHASTQAAVQGSAAARVARELGASRIVLPRETSLAEIARLRDEEPGLEYEAFVHGALCYSFSGLCLASGLVLGRSANRGECAQLCRSHYSIEGATGKKGYWFSCRDLDLGNRVAELAAAGISSLKVEGRMKSPEYCYAVASLYRGLLDRLDGEGPDDAEIESRREAARIAFSRSTTEGWLHERGGASLINAEYPGHRGIAAGRIVANEGGRLVVDLSSPLGLRDGLLGFDRGDPFRPLRFSALELRDARTGRELVRARSGSRVSLLAEADHRPCEGLRAGDGLRRISSRELDRRSVGIEEYEPAKQVLTLRLAFGPSGLEGELAPPAPGGARLWLPPGGGLPLDIATSPGGLERALARFSESGDADFRLAPEFDPAAIVPVAPGPDGTPRSCPAADLFIPPSALKREKNRMYAQAAELVAEAERIYARGSIAALSALASSAPAASPLSGQYPPRAALVFPREGLPSGMPFASPRDLAAGSALPEWEGRSWLPLAPLVADREAYAKLVKARCGSELASDKSVVLGLGALHHVDLARELRTAHPEAGQRLGFFFDINLYIANAAAYAALSALVPGLEFAYGYLEIEAPLDLGGNRIAPCGKDFEPPLFQSLGCFYKHHLVRGACPASCGKSWSGTLSDRDRRYRLIVEDCVTTLFRLGPASEATA